MIVDATRAPSQIKYPQDTELLNEAREITEEVIDKLHISGKAKKPRTYRKKARKQYLQIARSKKRTAKKIRKSIGQQLSYIRRNLKAIENMFTTTDSLPKALQSKLETVKKLYEYVFVFLTPLKYRYFHKFQRIFIKRSILNTM